MTEPVYIPRGTPYAPGEPYEFMMEGVLGIGPHLRYRCFRPGCGGMAIMVADRNTHNQYHNSHEER